MGLYCEKGSVLASVEPVDSLCELSMAETLSNKHCDAVCDPPAFPLVLFDSCSRLMG